MGVKLTDAQLVMMSTAAQRKDFCLSAPATFKGAGSQQSQRQARKARFGSRDPCETRNAIWRRDDSGQGYALKLTATGLKAIAVDEGSDEAIGASETAQAQPLPERKTNGSLDDVGRQTHAAAPRDGSKLALVIDLLRRADGATIVDLTESTGWLPHTTRAAITGLRKRGYAVVRERVGTGGSVYRISHAAPDGGDDVADQTDAADSHDREPKPRANQAA